MTLDTLAEATGLTKSFLSKVERGASVPSIATALRLAHAFGISVGQLLGEAEDSGAIAVLRRADRHSFMRGDAAGGDEDYVPLVPGRAVKAMEPFLVHPLAQFRSARLPSTHMGEEFIFVLAGSIEIDFGDHRSVVLEHGDSLYFDASLPHRTRSLGGVPAEVLIVVQP